MNNRIPLLTGLLALQLVLIGVFWIAQGSTTSEEGPWIALDDERVDRIEVSDRGSVVKVAKDNDDWMVDDYPADERKIVDILEKLVGLKAPWPVATSRDALQRFEVDEAAFQRRLRVYEGKEVRLDLYLGTSPGYQRVHARKGEDDEVYSVALSNYELPVNVDGWLDKALLASEDSPTKVAARFSDGRETVLRQQAEGWLVDDEAANQAEAQTYTDRFKTLRVIGVYTSDRTLTQLATIKLGDPVTQALEILREGEDGDYVVRNAGEATGFKVATYIAEQLLMTDADLAAKNEEESDARSQEGLSGDASNAG